MTLHINMTYNCDLQNITSSIDIPVQQSIILSMFTYNIQYRKTLWYEQNLNTNDSYIRYNTNIKGVPAK